MIVVKKKKVEIDMLVCGHGCVEDYCSTHHMVIVDTHDGDIDSYSGLYRIVVTDMEMSKSQYLFWKGKLLCRGYELISTKHTDDKSVAKFVSKYIRDHKAKYPGRCRFGFRRGDRGEVLPHEDNLNVVRRVFELHDKHYSYYEINNDEMVHKEDGRKLGTSTIQLIIKNRDKYREYL